jgi:hypothetical protein
MAALNNTSTISIKPVPSGMTKEDIAQAVKIRLSAGKIQLDSNSAETHGKAYLDFNNPTDATNALALLDGTMVFDQVISATLKAAAASAKANKAGALVVCSASKRADGLTETDGHLKSMSTLALSSGKQSFFSQKKLQLR